MRKLIYFCSRYFLSVAQLAEQLTLNQRVVGSSPTGETFFTSNFCGREVYPDEERYREALPGRLIMLKD